MSFRARSLALAMLLGAPLSPSWAGTASKSHPVSGFRKSGSVCTATVSVSISGSPSVVSTRFSGTSVVDGGIGPYANYGRPKNVELSVGGTSDGTTPSGTAAAWSGATNSFNGSSFSNGTWTMKITPAWVPDCTPTPSGAVPISCAHYCDVYDGTTLTFEYAVY